MSITDLIATGALLVSLVSLILSLRGYSVAKQSLDLSKKEYGNKNRGIIGYLIDGFRWAFKGEDFVSFAVSYTNNASEPNSFKDIYLEIEYLNSDKTFYKAKLPPQRGADPDGLIKNYQEMKIPITLSSKETKSGWMSFKLPKIKEKRVIGVR